MWNRFGRPTCSGWGTIKNAANIAATGPTLLGVVTANGQKVLLAGIDMKSVDILKPWWTLSGNVPGANGLLAGAEMPGYWT
jgi:hypothetical protein